MEKIEEQIIRISVRNLVEFVLQTGNIDNRRGGNEKEAMQEGTKIHHLRQNSQRKAHPDYRPEVALKRDFDFGEFTLRLEGRADGIYTNEDNVPVVEEIKGMYQRVSKLENPLEVHAAQALCYAYILAEEKDFPEVGILMTYCDLLLDETKEFYSFYDREQLRERFFVLVEKYTRWADFELQHRRERTASVRCLEFPYPYREGQRDVVVAAYRTMTMGKTLFVQAPTGIGKTLSTVFPAVKAMGEGYADKIFYMTAKSITGGVALDAFRILREHGLKAACVTLTAKEKICFLKAQGEQCDCNPISCPYALGHFDRVNDCVYDLITNEEHIDRETILIYAQKHKVCPFEMSLDVSTWVDLVVCDYNYVFDPHARLQRYFSEGVEQGDYIFLIDEAHNLVDRARNMYSAALVKEDFLDAARHYEGISHKLVNDCKRINAALLELKRDMTEEYAVLTSGDIGSVYNGALKLYNDIRQYEEDHPEFTDRDYAEFFFALRDFVNVYDNLDENYRIFTEFDQAGQFQLRLFCALPAVRLNECLAKGRSSIFFSATMLPMLFYKQVLRGHNEDYAIYTHSPFDSQRRLIAFAEDVTSKYTSRGPEEYMKIAEYLIRIVNAKEGNYMAFFPSFAFMEEVYLVLEQLAPDFRIICQESGMRETDREEFLNAFVTGTGESLLGMCVTGGVFSEGIDLREDKLIGVIVVGCGLPQICPEREVIRRCIGEAGMGEGYDYAYRYPGMNRILQAAGRLIRTQEDLGVIVMLDYRFLDYGYRNLFPREWSENRINVANAAELERAVYRFWQKMEE